MTIDERIEFLMQSIESHDRQLGELVDRIARTETLVADLTGTVGSLTNHVSSLTNSVSRLTETTQLNFDRLSAAMMGLTEHVADHRRRIETLEQ